MAAPFAFRLWNSASLLSAAEIHADYGEGVPGPGDDGVVGREDKAGEWFQRRRLSAQKHERKRDKHAAPRRSVWQRNGNLRVFSQERCSQLEQRKVQLTEQGKCQLKRAKSICNMQPNDSLSEELHNVSVHLIMRYLHVLLSCIQIFIFLVNAGVYKVAKDARWDRFHAEWGALQSWVLHRP